MRDTIPPAEGPPAALRTAGGGTGRRPPLKLAIYGKGGIGKSTIAANLSAAFAESGAAVLQFGCDPKRDSTRLLLGRKVKTALEHLESPRTQVDWMRFRRKALEPQRSLVEVVDAGLGLPEGMVRETVLHRGFGGCQAVEAGGPRPGVGCAGRGILTTFDLLKQLKVSLDDEFDVVVFDVLGDVVCGGFGVPLRHEHANAILVVTSEEFMPIYAANNILRGVANYDGERLRLAGLFLNRRDNGVDPAALRTFAASVELPVVAELSRSPLVQQADQMAMTLFEAFPESEEAEVFRRLARALVETDPVSGHRARALADEELERVVLGRDPARVGPPPAAPAVRREGPRPGGRTRRVAIYGKGGIGKSTIAANLSASLASRGLRVLQVGCDPKHDSSRLLLGGRRIPTVLERLRDVTLESQGLEDLVHSGALGVHCVESGGPEPGVGCAGRGILSAFHLLEKLGLRESDYDVILYDVLGDVVCGGFALPVRSGHADAVLLVTSEEFMPIYAANNILRGVNGSAGPAPRMWGVFHNARGPESGFATVERFAAAVNLPIVGRLPRSERVQEAERVALPLCLHAPGSPEALVLDELAGRLLEGAPGHAAAPLSDEALEELVLGRAAPRLPSPAASLPRVPAPGREPAGPADRFGQDVPDLRFCELEHAPADPFYYRIKPIRQPIYGCAFRSAADMALNVRDAEVVVHSPRSCAFLCRAGLASGASKALHRKGEILWDRLSPNLVCTDMGVTEMIHGGTDLLVDTLRRTLARRPPVVFLATACPPAIIGDDIVDAIRRAQPVSPETRIIPLRSDGNLSGGGLNGWLSGLFDGIFGMIPPRVPSDPPPAPHTVNLVCDWEHAHNAAVAALLAEVGIAVNSSFSVFDRNPRVEDLHRFHQAPLTLMGPPWILRFQMAAKYLRERFGTALSHHPFPRGLIELELWMREIGEFFGIEERVEGVLARHRAEYQRALRETRPALSGKRVAVFSYGLPMDWVLDVFEDNGMEIAFFGVVARREDLQYRQRHEGRLPIEFSFHPDRRIEVLERCQPDAVFGVNRHELPRHLVALDAAGVSDKEIGIEPAISLGRRFVNLLRAPLAERWRDDFVAVDKRRSALGQDAAPPTARAAEARP